MIHHDGAALEADASDGELLSAVRLGDRLAFQAIYDRYAPIVLAICERVLGRRADAEDAMAEVFVEVWSRRDRYEPRRGNPRAYLLMLARSRAIDLLRRHSVRPEHRHRSSTATPIADQLPSRGQAIETSAVDSEARTRILDALADLERQQREVLELAFYGGLSHQQISDRLAIPLGTVKTYIRKGLIKLRYALRGLDPESGELS